MKARRGSQVLVFRLWTFWKPRGNVPLLPQFKNFNVCEWARTLTNLKADPTALGNEVLQKK